MSSGTQNDMDWAGAGVPQTGAAAPETSAGTYPSDEEILGIDPPSPNSAHGGQARGTDALGGAETGKPQQAGINKDQESSHNTQPANRDTEDLLVEVTAGNACPPAGQSDVLQLLGQG
jgi:hypothetical protein